MGKALYRKYRSKLFSEIIGQDHITVTLSNAIKNKQISHAYLLTGPRGVGKTSVARILAHEINGLPYTEESQHLDIIEIDAASNRRIDEIRDLREKSRLAPTSAAFKVYIIDEVHMLTKEAFNALLKTLEEPPSHVVFILATTELHKLPATIVSRTQRFAFHPINLQDMTKHLSDIAVKEGIKISDEAINLIAGHANGGFRDAISLLDQVKNSADNITADVVTNILGVPNNNLIDSIIQYVLNSNAKGVFETLENLYSEGYSASVITESLLNECQKQLRANKFEKLLNLAESLLKVELSVNKSLALEIAILKCIDSSKENVSPPINIVEKPQKPMRLPEKENLKTKITPEVKDADIKPTVTDNDFMDIWKSTLSSIKKTHNTLYGILNTSKPELNEEKGVITLSFRFPFHLKKASEVKNQEIIKNALFSETSKQYALQFMKIEKVNKPVKKTVGAKKSSADNVISTVLNVFGGGEVVNK